MWRDCSNRTNSAIFGQTKIWKDVFIIWPKPLAGSFADSDSMKKVLPSDHCQNDAQSWIL
jgi:hypothetical protein